MEIEKLKALSRFDLSNFIGHENNVKHNIIIPFLQAFNQKDLNLEHNAQGNRIDINIEEKIIVETKALKENLDIHIDQIEKYCGLVRPVIAILTNGREFRIYTPLWQRQRTFKDTLIYELSLTDLTDENLLARLSKILSFTTMNSGDFLENIEERQNEILRIKKEIEAITKTKKDQTVELTNEIDELKEQVQEINEQIKAKEQIVIDIHNDKIPEVEEKSKEFYIPIKRNLQSIQNTPLSTTVTDEITDAVGDKFKIETRNGASAIGLILPNGNFMVLGGSLISKDTAPQFHRTAPSAFKKRNQYIKDGTIGADRKFTRNVEFKSKSGAAGVIMGDSVNGNRSWQKS